MFTVDEIKIAVCPLCTDVKLSISESSSDTQPDSFKHKDATAYIVEQSCLTVSHDDIKASGIPFSGSNLFIATISQVVIVAMHCV